MAQILMAFETVFHSKLSFYHQMRKKTLVILYLLCGFCMRLACRRECMSLKINVPTEDRFEK